MVEGIRRPGAGKAILVVSFGTSYGSSREKTIGAIERKIAESFPSHEVRRAFTSRRVIDRLAGRDGLSIDDVERALRRLAADGVGEVVVQPTHVIKGFEYEKMLKAAAALSGEFDAVRTGFPLLSSESDFAEAAAGLMAELPQKDEEDTAVVFMGHGTEHAANAAYGRLLDKFRALGLTNVFIGTVEGPPSIKEVMGKIGAKAYGRVVLLPLMVAAGDHAQNDMAGDGEESWKNIFRKAGFEVGCVLKGLGEYEGIRAIYVRHVREALDGPAAV